MKAFPIQVAREQDHYDCDGGQEMTTDAAADGKKKVCEA